MRNAALGALSALALATPAVAADLYIPPYGTGPGYGPEVHAYEYRVAPPSVYVEEPAPLVYETVVVRRPVIVAPPPAFVDEYPFYALPPPYAYGPAWRGGWDHRRFYGPW
jgi:hypothetical protein